LARGLTRRNYRLCQIPDRHPTNHQRIGQPRSAVLHCYNWRRSGRSRQPSRGPGPPHRGRPAGGASRQCAVGARRNPDRCKVPSSMSGAGWGPSAVSRATGGPGNPPFDAVKFTPTGQTGSPKGHEMRPLKSHHAKQLEPLAASIHLIDACTRSQNCWPDWGGTCTLHVTLSIRPLRPLRPASEGGGWNWLGWSPNSNLAGGRCGSIRLGDNPDRPA
jgi:hypothetical protein